mmetsp:Transcript_4268/g.9873  ORF Transcript_4268/g.9873 Transcript_4268/m.9873 type:complete len:239 (+) Transcript_4268:81-797(+)
MSAAPHEIIVLGIPVASEKTASLVRKVMSVSSIMAIIMCINVAVSMASGNSFAVIGLGILFIPACGYYGAKNKDVQYLSWFWGCTACCACLSCISIIGTLVVLDRVECLCSGACPAQEVGYQQEAVDVFCQDEDVWRAELILTLLTAVFDFFLQTLACTWGRRLAESDLIYVGEGMPGGMAMGAVEMAGQPRNNDHLPVATVVGGPPGAGGIIRVAPAQQPYDGTLPPSTAPQQYPRY